MKRHTSDRSKNRKDLDSPDPKDTTIPRTSRSKEDDMNQVAIVLIFAGGTVFGIILEVSDRQGEVMSRVSFDYHGQLCEVELTVHWGDAHDIHGVTLDGVPSDIDNQRVLRPH